MKQRKHHLLHRSNHRRSRNSIVGRTQQQQASNNKASSLLPHRQGHRVCYWIILVLSSSFIVLSSWYCMKFSCYWWSKRASLLLTSALSPSSSTNAFPTTSTSTTTTTRLSSLTLQNHRNDMKMSSGTSAQSQQQQQQQRIRLLERALWSFFAGDALASPSHWFYGGTPQVQQYYPPTGIHDYTKPVFHLTGSILNKSNMQGAGRAASASAAASSSRNHNNMNKYHQNNKPSVIIIIGDVINHGKQDLWAPTKQIHYHATLQAGEETLEASLARVLLRCLATTTAVSNNNNNHFFDANQFRQAYVDFMMTPGSHNDTYASTCHRMFFANMIYHNKPAVDCPDNDGHNVDTIDGLVLPTIVSLVVAAHPNGTLEQAVNEAVACVAVTRNSRALQQVTAAWAELVFRTLRQEEPPTPTPIVSSSSSSSFFGRQKRSNSKSSSILRQNVEYMAQRLGYRQPQPRGDAVTACYLDSAVPAMLDSLMTFDEKIRTMTTTTTPSNTQGGDVTVEHVWKALLSNANAGGENVHRGSCLGAVLGSVTTVSNVDNAGEDDSWKSSRLVQGLYHHEELQKEIQAVIKVIEKASGDANAS